MTMTVHDALEAWRDGRIPEARAIELTGAADVVDLHVFARSCDVEIGPDTGLPPEDMHEIARRVALVHAERDD
jgi:hypothetical protein